MAPIPECTRPEQQSLIASVVVYSPSTSYRRGPFLDLFALCRHQPPLLFSSEEHVFIYRVRFFVLLVLRRCFSVLFRAGLRLLHTIFSSYWYGLIVGSTTLLPCATPEILLVPTPSSNTPRPQRYLGLATLLFCFFFTPLLLPVPIDTPQSPISWFISLVCVYFVAVRRDADGHGLRNVPDGSSVAGW